MPNVVVSSAGRCTLAAIAAASLTAACASTRVKPVDERARVEAATHHYASLLRGAPIDSIAAAYTEHGELVIPGVGTLRGRAGIRDFLAPLSAMVSVASVEMQIDSIAVTGSTATEVGRYVQMAGPKGTPPREFRGSFRATWQREGDGQWRLARLVMQPTAAKAP